MPMPDNAPNACFIKSSYIFKNTDISVKKLKYEKTASGVSEYFLKNQGTVPA
jgi:hypothetical protein